MLPPLDQIEPFPEPSAAALPWLVLVVAGTDRRCEQVQIAVERLQGDLQVECADTVVDALLRLTRRPAELLLLDIAMDDAFAAVVVRHLARVAPLTTVMLFDDLARTVPGQPTVLDWRTLDAQLQRWWQSRRQPTDDPAAPNAENEDPA